MGKLNIGLLVFVLVALVAGLANAQKCADGSCQISLSDQVAHDPVVFSEPSVSFPVTLNLSDGIEAAPMLPTHDLAAAPIIQPEGHGDYPAIPMTNSGGFVETKSNSYQDVTSDTAATIFRRRRSFRPNRDRRRYISGDAGIAVPSNNAGHFGTTRDTIGGLPFYDLDDGLVSRLAIGTHVGQNFRFEFEGSYRSIRVLGAETASGALAGDRYFVNGSRDATSLMFNLFRDIKIQERFTPYLKGGLGMTFNRAGVAYNLARPGFPPADLVYPKNESFTFSWSAGGGVAIPVTHRLIMDIEYTFMQLGEAGTDFDANGDGMSFGDGFVQEVTAGFRFEF